MRTEQLRVSPTGAFALIAAIGVISLLVHALAPSNSGREARPLPVALVSLPPPPPQQLESIEPKQQPEPVQAVDMRAFTPDRASSNPASERTRSSGPLGLNEAGGAGSDAFGLAGRPGGRELLSTGGGGGGEAARFVQFAGQIQSDLQEQLNQITALKRACYTVDIALRVTPAGSFEGVRIIASTGDRALDGQISSALGHLPPMAGSPPVDMPWPVRLRIVSNSADCEPGGASPAGHSPQ